MRMLTNLLIAGALLAGLGCAGAKDTPYGPDTTTLAPGQQLENPPNWYVDAVAYHVWVKAYADGIHNDGIGDLPGLRGRLDYLQNLGINTIWLSPIFECSYKGENMHGYDTVDYYALNDRFGTKADLKSLIDDVHSRGMRIIFDFVPNHTSTSHPWFTDGNTSGSWYLWQTTLPSNWGYPWGGGTSSDVWKPGSRGYFYTAFGTGSLADLNYYNPSVVSALQDVERYWLDRGFDGMRVDAARYLCESGPGQGADQPDTHARLKGFRSVLDEYATGDTHPHPGGNPAKHSVKMMIAEAWTDGAPGIAPYYGNGTDEFNLCLDFSHPWAVFTAINGSDATQLTGLWEYEQQHYPAGYRSATFDSNHDNLISRPGTQYGGDARKIILAEALNLLSPGTPILYYGNEIGMTGAAGTDLNLRQPMDWAAVSAQSGQPESILSWCRYLIQARNSYPALRGGYATLATDLGAGKALACVRDSGSERILVVANLTAQPQSPSILGLDAHGIPADGAVSAILGDLKGVGTLSGSTYRVSALPPYGIRVIYAAGSAFRTTIHGDRP
jgi:alpha-glucosidase